MTHAGISLRALNPAEHIDLTVGARVGRAFESTVVLDDARFSAVHFRLDSTGALHDLSTNGTFVNGTRIGKGNCTTLAHGDVVTLCVPSLTSACKVFKPSHRAAWRVQLDPPPIGVASAEVSASARPIPSAQRAGSPAASPARPARAVTSPLEAVHAFALDSVFRAPSPPSLSPARAQATPASIARPRAVEPAPQQLATPAAKLAVPSWPSARANAPSSGVCSTIAPGAQGAAAPAAGVGAPPPVDEFEFEFDALGSAEVTPSAPPLAHDARAVVKRSGVTLVRAAGRPRLGTAADAAPSGGGGGDGGGGGSDGGVNVNVNMRVKAHATLDGIFGHIRQNKVG
jgi:hypothetical protein